MVRDATSFGLPGFIRVCARPAADDERLLSALRDEVLR
jgi:histidinol-phosphate/aromatic aminotransferase/cobyric acid decarboxylase-like protein